MGVSSLFTSFPLAMSNWLVFAVSLGFLNTEWWMRNTALTGLYEKANPVFIFHMLIQFRCCDYQIQYLKIGEIHFLAS